MNYKITNVKVSVKIGEVCLDTVAKKLKEKNIVFKQFQNYLVIQNVFTFIIFRSSYKLKSSLCHVNITKIPTVNDIERAKSHLEELLNIEKTVQPFNIDNITASIDLGLTILPEKIISIFNKDCKITFNKETFPGVFLKFEKGTAIIFHTGKCIVIGCKNITDVERLTSFLLIKLREEKEKNGHYV